MNRSYQFFFLISFSLMISIACFGQDAAEQKTRVTSDMIEETLLTGAKSDNEGLRISSSYYLGETESEDAVIPLMDILHTDKSDQARIMAALSLFKIGDSSGIYAIKKNRRIRFQ